MNIHLDALPPVLEESRYSKTYVFWNAMDITFWTAQ
jgi:hypothetical protein